MLIFFTHVELQSRKDVITYFRPLVSCHGGSPAVWGPQHSGVVSRLVSLRLESSRGLGGTEVIKNTASVCQGLHAWLVFCGFEDAACLDYHRMKRFKIIIKKTESAISMSVNYRQSHLSLLIRLVSCRGLWIFTRHAWFKLMLPKGKCNKIRNNPIKDYIWLNV